MRHTRCVRIVRTRSRRATGPARRVTAVHDHRVMPISATVQRVPLCLGCVIMRCPCCHRVPCWAYAARRSDCRVIWTATTSHHRICGGDYVDVMCVCVGLRSDAVFEVHVCRSSRAARTRAPSGPQPQQTRSFVLDARCSCSASWRCCIGATYRRRTWGPNDPIATGACRVAPPHTTISTRRASTTCVHRHASNKKSELEDRFC